MDQIVMIAIIAVLCGIGAFYVTTSLKHMEISSMLPLTNISPIILIFLSWFILNELVTWVQALGIFAVLIGAYILETKDIVKPKQFFKKVWKNKYIHYTLFGIVLYAFSSLGNRYLLRDGLHPFTYIFFLELFITVILLTITFLHYGTLKGIPHAIKKSGWWILLGGVAVFFSNLSQFFAVSMANVALVITIKRSSTLFSTIIGGEMFHDHGLKRKIFACAIMILGVLLVSL